MRSRVAVAVTVLFVSLAAGTSAAGADSLQGGPQAFTILGAKSKDAKYKQYQTVDLDKGEKRTFFWKVESTVQTDETYAFDDAATGDSASGYKITWYKGKKQKKDISAQVKNDGFEYTLKGEKTKYFNAVVKATGNAQDNACLGGQNGSATEGYNGAYFGLNGECT